MILSCLEIKSKQSLVPKREEFFSPSWAYSSFQIKYEILGVAERADENQIESAYRERVKEWDPSRLQYRDDILLMVVILRPK